MSNNVTASRPAIGGAVFRAPVGTTLPTDATTALNSAFKSLGYISEDGLTKSSSPETTVIKEWGGNTVLTIMSSREVTFKGKFISSQDTEVLKMVHGDDNVTGTIANGITVRNNSADLDHYSYVIETIESDDVLHRIVIPDAVPTEIGDVTYVMNDAVAFEVTLGCIIDSSGNSVYDYYEKSSS